MNIRSRWHGLWSFFTSIRSKVLIIILLLVAIQLLFLAVFLKPAGNSYFSWKASHATRQTSPKDFSLLQPSYQNFNWAVELLRIAVPTTLRHWIFLLLVCGPVLLTLSLGWLILWHVVRPLESLEDGIKVFEAGLLAEPLPVLARDEIGQLTRSFNQMVQTLRQRNEELQRKTRNLAFVNEITGIINQSIDLSTFLDSSLRKITGTLQSAFGWIYIFNPQIKKMDLIAHEGLPAHWLANMKHPPLVDALLAQAFVSGKPSVLHDYVHYLPGPKNLIPYESVRDLLLVPLHSKKRRVGLLVLASRAHALLRQAELDLLICIGNELGVAIENALLYLELQLKIKEREESNRDLQELDRFKNRILSNVSHELRTPITAIKTYVELFLQGKIGSLTGEQADKMGIVSRNINNLLALINDLLTSAKTQDNKLQLKDLEIHSVQNVADTVIADMLEMARTRGLLLARTGVEKPVLVRINRQKIIQVLHNLISNAIKFTEHGKITIDLKLVESTAVPEGGSVPGTAVEITVLDTGIGIPKKSLKKIFQRFYQVDGSSTRKYAGTGLGLAIAKEIVEAHGSDLQVESRIQQGSRFWFTLPVITNPELK